VTTSLVSGANTWREDCYGKKDLSTSEHVSPYRAPFWSRAATDEPVLYDYRDEYHDQYASRTCPSSLQLLDHHVTLKNNVNRFGEVRVTSITIRALALPLIRSEQQTGRLDISYLKGQAYLDENPLKPDSKDVYTGLPEYVRTSPSLFMLSPGVENHTYLLAINQSLGDIADFEVDLDLTVDETYLGIIVML
jgi:hypothetical protein